MRVAGQPKIALDGLGFPCVTWGDGRIGLLPVTKVQAESVLGRPGAPGGDCYHSGCEVNPRATWRAARDDCLEAVFLTGLLPEEAVRLAGLYDQSARLPEAGEWRLVDRCLWGRINPDWLARLSNNPRLHPAARAILGLTIRKASPPTGRSVGLFDAGILEWVATADGGYGLYGRCPARLCSILLDPQAHDPARPLGHDRHPAFGFRLAYGPPVHRPLAGG